ncbi:MAG: cytochrome P450 [Acidimicrobiales bacterium]
MPTYDPADVGYALDPWPLYDRLRSEVPIHRSPQGMWVLARHADCLAVLRDRRASADSTHIDPDRMPEGFAGDRHRSSVIDEMVEQAERDNRPFLFRDPPDHTRLRGLVSKAFTPRMIEELRPRTLEIVTQLIDVGLERGEIDAVADFAYPLPVRIICDMLGVPAADQTRFPAWSAALARGLDPEFLLTDDVRQARMDALVAFAEYFFELLADRRQHPGPDLLSRLVEAEDGGDTLSEGELLSTAILLLVAGHETTVNLIGGSVLALIEHPDQMTALRADPSLARNGVEELLRYVSPVQLTGRTMVDDLEVGGEVLGRGEFAVLLIGSANRDPAAFDTPATLVLARPDIRHLGFGFGIHHCLGAPLARLETQVALTELLRRTARVELATDHVTFRQNVVLRGLADLPVRLVPA